MEKLSVLATLVSVPEFVDLLTALEKAQVCAKSSPVAGKVCDLLEEALEMVRMRVVEDPEAILDICPSCGVTHDSVEDYEDDYFVPKKEDPQA